jgi:pilus assembly protein Flp/PilA
VDGFSAAAILIISLIAAFLIGRLLRAWCRRQCRRGDDDDDGENGCDHHCGAADRGGYHHGAAVARDRRCTVTHQKGSPRKINPNGYSFSKIYTVTVSGFSSPGDCFMLILLTKLFKSQHGATAIEYGLIAALISIAAVTIMGTVGSNLTSVFTTVAGDL